MRALHLLLGLSLLANLGLAIVHFRQPASPATAPAAAAAAASSNVTPVSSGASDDLGRLPALLHKLQTGDLTSELAELRRLGLPEDTINTLAEGVIMRRFREGMAALNRDDNMNFWQGGYALTKDQRERQQKMMQLVRDLSEQARLAGIRWDMLYHESHHGMLSEEKAVQVARIKQDREEMRSQIYMESQGLMLERDREKLRFIEEEYQRDLAATLTPQELAEWELRTSSTARQLQSQLAHMRPTEQEFRQIYQLQAAFDAAWSTENQVGGDIDWGKRSEAQNALKEDIARVLGPERYADYARSTDRDYGTLSNLEYRLGLPAGTADRLYPVRAQTDAAAAKIRADSDLDADAKKTALKALADQVTQDMTTALGDEGFQAYRQQSGRWIDALAR